MKTLEELQRCAPCFTGVPDMRKFSAGEYYKVSDVEEILKSSHNKQMDAITLCVELDGAITLDGKVIIERGCNWADRLEKIAQQHH